MPNLPSMPTMPALPSMPTMPNLPSIPTMPALPSMPNLPNMPSMTSMPAPNIPAIQSMQAQTGGVDFLSQTITALNANPYLIGIMMLFLNLGGRFLSLELTKKQEEFLQTPWLRPFIFFTVLFIATRNLVVAFWTTLLFFFVIWVIANENSPFCIVPTWCKDHNSNESINYLNNVKKMMGMNV